MLSGVSRYLHTNGPWSTFLELRAFESALPPWLQNWDGDGILTRTHCLGMADAIAAAGIPTIELRSTNQNRGIPSFGMNNAPIVETVAEHLLNRGYPRFAAYTLDTESFSRNESVISSVVLSGQEPLCPAPGPERGEPGRLGATSDKIDAMAGLPRKGGRHFATNDQLALHLLNACRRSNIAVPEEVAVVGCDNEETLCEFASPALTSVKFDGATVGTLERRMKASLQRGTKDEIRRVQFREVNRLLRNSDLMIETIPELTGFTHAHYLQTSFRERYGMTPGSYRKQIQSGARD